MSAGIGRRRARVALGLGVLSVGLLGSTAIFLLPAGASDNPSCPQGTTEIKVDANPLSGLSVGESASFAVDGQTFTFTKVTGPDPFEDDTFDFTSTIAVSDVFVKGGTGALEYPFDPAATSGSTLHPPLNGIELDLVNEQQHILDQFQNVHFELVDEYDHVDDHAHRAHDTDQRPGLDREHFDADDRALRRDGGAGNDDVGAVFYVRN